MLFIRRIRYFINHRFVRDTVLLQMGSVGGVFVQALASVLLARWLGPEQYGLYALAFSVASVASIFLGAGAVDAIAPTASRAWHGGDGVGLRIILAFLFRFIVIASGVSIAIAMLLPFMTSHLYGSSAVGVYAVIILGASIVSSLGYAILSLGLQLAGRIWALSVLTFVDSAMRMMFALLFVIIGVGVLGAACGHLIGALCITVVVAAIWISLEHRNSLWPSLRRIITTARDTNLREHLRAVLWVLADRNISMLFGALPVVLVGLYVTTAEVAFFKVALSYMLLAMSIFSPISQLLNVEFPKMQITHSHRLRHQFVRITLYSLALSSGVTAAVLAVAPWVFRILYGYHFLSAVPLAFGLAGFGALYGVGVGLGPMWRALGKVKVSIFINAVTLGIGVPLGILMIKHWGLWGAVAMTTMWYCGSQLTSFFYLERYLRSLEKRT